MQLFKLLEVIPLIKRTSSTIRNFYLQYRLQLDKNNLRMNHPFLTILLFLQGTLLTSWACPTLNGVDSNTCDECSVYDYVIYETSVNTMFLNVNITIKEMTNEIKEFKSVLTHGSPTFYGREERTTTSPPCYFSRVSGTSRTGCGQEIKVNTTSDGSLLCPWTYECDYDKNRIPQYLWKAVCYSSGQYPSRPISYRVPTLRLDNTCNPFQSNTSWKLKFEDVPVACVCFVQSNSMQ